MAVPTTEAEFKAYCLRKLGDGVIEINVTSDQVDDRVDEALKYYWDYHFDGMEKLFYKHVWQENDFPDKLKEIVIVSGGTGYSNNDTITITNATGDVDGAGATATLRTNANGVITSTTVTGIGSNYRLDPKVTITTSTGTGADLRAYKGGYVSVPDNISGMINIFALGDYVATNNLFNIRYQIALNDLYTLTYQSMVPYFMAFQHIQLLEQLLVGQQPIRYNRLTSRLYIDVNWDKIDVGTFLLVEAYQVIDPSIYPKIWGDRWLQRYCSQLIKRQWGSNLTKFTGMSMPGGVQFNGEKIYDDAVREIDKLEEEMSSNYSLPAYDMIG